MSGPCVNPETQPPSVVAIVNFETPPATFIGQQWKCIIHMRSTKPDRKAHGASEPEVESKSNKRPRHQ